MQMVWHYDKVVKPEFPGRYVGAKHVDDRRASLLRSGQEIPASRLCRNARPSAFIGDGRRRHDGGKGHAVSQGRILIPLEEGMRSLGRGLAAWLLRGPRRVAVGTECHVDDRRASL